MITRAEKEDPEFPEGSYYVGQGAYTLEVVERFNSSMNYNGRTTPIGSQNPSPKVKTKRDILKKVQNIKTNMMLIV
eukprot:11190672-Prorocentrum_lima.AAC.1